MVEQEIYPITIDDTTGRAYVEVSGVVNAAKIGNTFFAVILRQQWILGDRSIVWHVKGACVPESFSFSDILKKAETVKNFTKPGKSAIVIEGDVLLQKRVAGFYRNLGEAITVRQLAVFDTLDEAEKWLNA
ncbi:MAG: hypothetical protein ACOWWM_20185 [Desulfobacterales bacterium]